MNKVQNYVYTSCEGNVLFTAIQQRADYRGLNTGIYQFISDLWKIEHHASASHMH